MKLNLLKTISICKNAELKLSFSLDGFTIPFTLTRSHIDILIKEIVENNEDNIHLSMYN